MDAVFFCTPAPLCRYFQPSYDERVSELLPLCLTTGLCWPYFFPLWFLYCPPLHLPILHLEGPKRRRRVFSPLIFSFFWELTSSGSSIFSVSSSHVVLFSLGLFPSDPPAPMVTIPAPLSLSLLFRCSLTTMIVFSYSNGIRGSHWHSNPFSSSSWRFSLFCSPRL